LLLDLDRLTRITQDFAPYLRDYPELLKYADLLRRLLDEREIVAPELLAEHFEVLPGVDLVVPSVLMASGAVEAEDDFWQKAEVEVITIEYGDEPVLKRYEFEVATLRVTEEVLELEDVLEIANEAMKARTGKELTLVWQEIIKGAWYKQSYVEIANQSLLPPYEVKKVAASLFRNLSKELRISISKSNIAKAFSQFTGKATKAGLEIVRVPGAAEQFVELLGAGDALSLSQGVELAMVRIPAGEFMMGSLSVELEGQDNEKPQHLVKVPEFYFGKYPVTQAQWRSIANLSAINQELNPDPSTFKGDSLPVETVSWLDVIEFCARLSGYTGREYGLPSEAEWEYACRANTVTPFHFGETIDSQVANYNGGYVYGRGQKGIDRSKTIPVGSLNAANEYGLHDMHGNVWEWCQDHWHNNYQGAPENGSTWINTNASLNNYKVMRGGSWDTNPSYCRSAIRNYSIPANRINFVGFRVVSRAMTS
jgi:formylglycine-generating enzyme required for sulfatase activity